MNDRLFMTGAMSAPPPRRHRRRRFLKRLLNWIRSRFK